MTKLRCAIRSASTIMATVRLLRRLPRKMTRTSLIGGRLRPGRQHSQRVEVLLDVLGGGQRLELVQLLQGEGVDRALRVEGLVGGQLRLVEAVGFIVPVAVSLSTHGSRSFSVPVSGEGVVGAAVRIPTGGQVQRLSPWVRSTNVTTAECV